MMSKKSRPLIFFYTFLLTFIVLIVTLYTYFFANSQRKWMLELITTRLFKVPIIVYIVIIAIAVSGIVFSILYLVNRHTYGKIEEQLHFLSVGNYDHLIFSDKEKSYQEDGLIDELEQDVQNVRSKMLAMSKELQDLSAVPKYVDGESKEDIIKSERQRIARELHDSVSQQLFAATMMLSALNEAVEDMDDIPDIIESQLQVVAGIINTSQSEMRALLLHLRPINLEEKTLQQGIEMLLQELQTKINIELKWQIEDVSLPSSIEDNLFRISQELLSNTLRHAQANLLEVYLKKIDQTVLLRLVDDGVGFDVNEEKVGSYGLQNIRERVQGMGGTSRIVSFKGQGTSIEIKVPILKEERDD
ncbi:sensor histidine kinase [Vagococcus sp. JNUCC 83]